MLLDKHQKPPPGNRIVSMLLSTKTSVVFFFLICFVFFVFFCFVGFFFVSDHNMKETTAVVEVKTSV